MTCEAAWAALLDEFRTLGGTAENICLRHGAHGRGVFALDPAKPVAIRIPENLLLNIEDAVFQEGEFRVYPLAKIGDRERAFLERYENEFSWGGGGRTEVEHILTAFQELPASLGELLVNEFGFHDWFAGTSSEVVQRRFLESRTIEYKGRTVVMPIIELLNHGALTDYDCSDGVAVRGQFAGELLVQYSISDPLTVFCSWGFAHEQEAALSAPIGLQTAAGPLHIQRRLDAQTVGQKTWVPELKIEDGKMSLPYLLIGNRKFPRLPRGIFHSVMKNSGLARLDELFDLAQHLNRLKFLNLLRALEGVAGPMAQQLRNMTYYQLGSMSHYYGMRQI